MKELKIISFIGMNSCMIMANVSEGENSTVFFTILSLYWAIGFIYASFKKR